jgi:DNA repair photolyase
MNSSLPAQVEAWLRETSPRSRPAFVSVGLAAEPLPGFADSTAMLGRALAALLEAGVGISLRTRRNLPDSILDIFRQHPELVRITIPLPLLDNLALSRWEPGTASASQRLFTIQRLRAARLAVQVAVKPLIPFVNDDEAHLAPLVSAISDLGIKKIAASFLRLTPAVKRRLESASAPVSARLIFGAYLERRPEGDAVLRMPPLERRRATYERLDGIARDRGARLALCHCADPDLGEDSCLLWPEDIQRGQATRTVGAASSESESGRQQDGASSRRTPAQVGFTDLLRR